MYNPPLSPFLSGNFVLSESPRLPASGGLRDSEIEFRECSGKRRVLLKRESAGTRMYNPPLSPFLKGNCFAILIFLLISRIAFPQWVLVDSIPISVSASLSAADSNIVWVAGGLISNPYVYRSTNGGYSFVNVTGNITGNELYACWGANINTCYVGDGGAPSGSGGNAKVWKTTNGGVNWNVILTTGGTAGYVNGIAFCRTNSNYGIVESDPPLGPGTAYWVEYTTDGGNTWTSRNPPGITNQASAQNTPWIIDANHFGFGSANSNITAPCYAIWTSDAGITWNNTQLTVPGYFVCGYSMDYSFNNGIVLTDASLPSMNRFSNGNFTTVNGVTSCTGIGISRWVPGTQVDYMVTQYGPNGAAEKTIDGGVTWTEMTTDGVTSYQDMDLISVNSVVYAYAMASNGSIIKLVDEPIGIKPISNIVPQHFELAQNFPNPFNPSTVISYQLAVNSYVTLKVFDIAGREVTTLTNGYRIAGSYSETFDASNLASGVYFYSVRASNFFATKKMILVK